jgi:hypothetical protein
LEEFRAAWKGDYPGNSYQPTHKQTDSKGFCENFGKSGKTPRFIHETYSWLGRVWSVTSGWEPGKVVGLFYSEV